MKKLLFILLFLPLFSFGQQGGPTINQIQPNLFTGGVWKKIGTNFTPSSSQSGAVGEPTVLFETGPQILTNPASGQKVFKMWFSTGLVNVDYAESYDGIKWIQSATHVVTSHMRNFVIHQGSTYYLYAANSTATQIDCYTSSTGAPGSFTLHTSAVFAKGGTGWRQNTVQNSSMFYDSGSSTFYALVEGQSASGAFTMGEYSSSDGFTWTEYGSNPVINFNWGGGPDLKKIGSTWYCWFHAGAAAGSNAPADVYRAHASSPTGPWTLDNSSSPVMPRTLYDEGFGTTVGGVADMSIVEANGLCYMFYTATIDETASPTNASIKVAIANCSLANLVLTNEGCGGMIYQSAIPSIFSATGQILAAGSISGTPYTITPNNTTSQYFLTQTGNGTSSNVPSWYNLFSGSHTWTSASGTSFSVGSLGNITLTGTNPYMIFTNGTYGLNIAVASNAAFFSNISQPGDVVMYANGASSNGSMIYEVGDNTGDHKFSTYNGQSVELQRFTIKQSGNVSVGETNTPTANFQVTQGTHGYGKITTTASSGAVVGTSTQFTNTFQPGQTITAFGETHTITSITDDTHLTTDNWTNTNSTPGAYTLVGGTAFQVFGHGDTKLNHLGGLTSAPTIAAGTGAGTSPTVSIAGNDIAQKVTITTGTSPTVSATVATITFNVAYTTAPRVILTPANANAAALNGTAQVYVDDSAIGTTSYVISVGSGGLAASTTYLFYAHVIQ